MPGTLKNLILKFTPRGVINFFFYNHQGYKKFQDAYLSYSQEGEDMVLRRIFDKKANGIYVDVGAHQPVRFSNTNFFHQRGWSGINIDGLPGSKVQFDAARPGDTNLELLVSINEGMTDFYLFEPSLMNTMSEKQALKNQKFDWCKLLEVVKIPSLPLSKILDKYLPPGKGIDFMSIDVEGAEISVLKSNNWEKYAPDVLLVEIIDMNIEDIFATDVHRYLKALSYNLFAKTGNTLFYKKKFFFEF